MRRLILPAVLAATMFSSSCIGPNNAFNGVNSWNSRVSESKWVNELLYIGLWVIPVYPLALTGDTLIFNSWEFWGGDNPIDDPEPMTRVGG